MNIIDASRNGMLALSLICCSASGRADPPPAPAAAATSPAAAIEPGQAANAAAPVSAAPENATERNDIPSCYKFAHLDQYADKPSSRELVVVIDQTTALTAELRDAARAAAEQFIKAGDEVVIYQFSAYEKKDYLRLQFRGRTETDLPKQVADSVGGDDLRVFVGCRAQQMTFFANLFKTRFDASLGQATMNMDKSEILFSLKQIAADLHKRPVAHRVVLLISDMLENSEFSSFYQKSQVRLLDPEAEMTRVKKKDLLSDFDGAHIYVHGAGLIDPSAKQDYRSGVTIKALQQFWTSYFLQSNAALEAFGAPELTVDLQ